MQPTHTSASLKARAFTDLTADDRVQDLLLHQKANAVVVGAVLTHNSHFQARRQRLTCTRQSIILFKGGFFSSFFFLS